jgi:tetratricopeptide (TPR) repeat protein
MAKHDPKELQALLDEANALLEKADWKKAVAVLDVLTDERSEDPRTTKLYAKAILLRGYCASELSLLARAIKDYEKALSLAGSLKDPLLQGELNARLVNAHWRKGDRDEAIAYLDKAQRFVDATKDLWLGGLVHLERATLHMLVLKPEVVEKEYRDAILALEKAGDMRELARAYNNLGTNFLYREDFKRAAEIFEKCKKIAQRGGYDPFVAWGSFNRAGCLSELGMYKEALAELDSAMPILIRTHDDFGVEGAQQAYGLTYARMKDWDKAEEHFLIARAMAKKCEMPFAEGEVLYDMARMYKWRGDKVRAKRFFKEAREIFEKLVATHEVEKIDRDLKEMS